jgi:hypothetical protein
MNPLKLFAVALTSAILLGCSTIQTDAWEPTKFAAGNYETYSWRSEPIRNTIGSGDPIYKVDPLLRAEVDKTLQAKGYQKIVRGGDFTVDYLFAPGLVAGTPSDEASNITPYAGIRPNVSVDGAQRDNAIALGGGVRETRNIGIQINDGKSGLEIWRGVITKFVENVNRADRERINSAVQSGVSSVMRGLPKQGASE